MIDKHHTHVSYIYILMHIHLQLTREHKLYLCLCLWLCHAMSISIDTYPSTHIHIYIYYIYKSHTCTYHMTFPCCRSLDSILLPPSYHIMASTCWDSAPGNTCTGSGGTFFFWASRWVQLSTPWTTRMIKGLLLTNKLLHASKGLNPIVLVYFEWTHFPFSYSHADFSDRTEPGLWIS